VAGTRVLNSSAADKLGYEKLAAWMAKAEAIWEELSSSGTMTLLERWNYQRGLSNQLPIGPLRVVYAASGTLPAAVVLRDDEAIIEHILYWATADSEEEAHYLAAILNSEAGRARAEQFQARGQFGARHFDKVIFNLSIPRFNAKNPLHRALSNAGERAEAAAKLVDLVHSEKFQRARKRVRDALTEHGIAPEIDELVEKLLDGVVAD